MRALVSVDGFDFPEPSTYKANTATIVDSGRNVKGYVVGTIVREDVAKVSLTWRYLTTEQWAKICQCFSKKHGGSFYNDVTFFNQTSNRWETRKMYVSDRSASIFRREPTTGELIGYTEPSLSLIEV